MVQKPKTSEQQICGKYRKWCKVKKIKIKQNTNPEGATENTLHIQSQQQKFTRPLGGSTKWYSLIINLTWGLIYNPCMHKTVPEADVQSTQ